MLNEKFAVGDIVVCSADAKAFFSTYMVRKDYCYIIREVEMSINVPHRCLAVLLSELVTLRDVPGLWDPVHFRKVENESPV